MLSHSDLLSCGKSVLHCETFILSPLLFVEEVVVNIRLCYLHSHCLNGKAQYIIYSFSGDSVYKKK